MAKPLLSRFPFKLRLFIAVLVAALGSDVTSRKGWRRLWQACALWFTIAKTKARASDDLYADRLACCRGCPIWYAPLGTCGSPLVDELGCWCFMEEKAKWAASRCWLDEDGQGDIYGWSKIVGDKPAVQA